MNGVKSNESGRSCIKLLLFCTHGKFHCINDAVFALISNHYIELLTLIQKFEPVLIYVLKLTPLVSSNDNFCLITKRILSLVRFWDVLLVFYLVDSFLDFSSCVLFKIEIRIVKTFQFDFSFWIISTNVS